VFWSVLLWFLGTMRSITSLIAVRTRMLYSLIRRLRWWRLTPELLTLPSKLNGYWSSPMSDEASLRGDCQDSRNESPISSGPNSPILVSKTIVSDRGALILGCLIAVGLATWSTARVGYLHDEFMRQGAEYSHRADQQAAAFSYHAMELQTNYLLHVAQQHSEVESEMARYREQFQSLERQFRMTELKYDNVNISMRRAGIYLPNDYWTGPNGNLDAESFHISNKGK